MRIRWTIWKDEFAAKIAGKHGVTADEVEEALRAGPLFRRAERGRVSGEDLYAAYGRSGNGRYLVIFFLLKAEDSALPISARDRTDSERRYYATRTQRG